MTCTCSEVFDSDCECAIGDGDCIAMSGSGGSTNPFSPIAMFDPDEDNILSCTASGLLAILPLAIRQPPRCSVYYSVDLSTDDDDGIVVPMDSERYDHDTMHNNSTNNSHVTFKTAGVYVVTFNGTFSANTGGDRSAWIRKNGKDFLGAQQKRATVDTNEDGLSVTIQEAFEEGDYVEAIVQQDCGSSLNLLATRYSPVLTAIYRAPFPTS